MLIPQYLSIRYYRVALHMDQKLWPWKSKGPWNDLGELTLSLVWGADEVGGKFWRNAKLITPPMHVSHPQKERKKEKHLLLHATFYSSPTIFPNFCSPQPFLSQISHPRSHSAFLILIFHSSILPRHQVSSSLFVPHRAPHFFQGYDVFALLPWCYNLFVI